MQVTGVPTRKLETGDSETWSLDQMGQHLDAIATHHLQPALFPGTYRSVD